MGDMETMVTSLITSPEAYKLRTFTFSGKTFNSGVFYQIKELINAGFIKVVYEEKRAGSAEYDTGTNTLYLGFSKTFDLGQKALVVHEIVHAVFDMVKMKMSVADSESIAYIVQCMYARMNNNDPTIRLKSTTKARDKVFETGWNLAGKIIDGQGLNSDDCNAMRDAVSMHPYYMANASHDAKMNG
jgi:hypothetical protein